MEPIPVGQQRFWAMFGGDGGEAARDQVDRRLPRHPLELTGALWSNASERVQQAVGVVGPGGVVVDLRTEDAAGKHVVLGATHRGHVAVLDPGASVLAVQGAAALYATTLAHPFFRCWPSNITTRSAAF